MDELIVESEINSKILVLRGKQVMLDRLGRTLWCRDKSTQSGSEKKYKKIP